jgi:hypothetical protein
MVLALASNTAPSLPVTGDLQARENEYTEGVLTSNTRLLDDVWAPSFVDTNEAGGFATKQQQLAKLAHSRVRIVSLKVDDERTDVYGDTAVVTERFHVVYDLGGKEGEEAGRATDVWVKMKGRWMCVAAHSSAMAPPAKP